MRNRWISSGIAVAFVALVGAAVAGQGGNGGGGQGGGNGSGGGSGIDPATRTTFVGDVLRFEAVRGQGTPQLAVAVDGEEKTFVLGPYWYLSKSGFAADAGDDVEVDAFACTSCTAGWAVAEVRNLSKATTLELRDENGLPLWTGGGRGRGGRGGAQEPAAGRGNGAGRGECGGEGPDMDAARDLDGVVVSFSGGPGVGRPTLILAVGGVETAVVASPYRVLQNAGVAFVAGERWLARVAPSADGTHLVALTLKNPATGFELVLRDPETGLPLWTGGGHGGRGGHGGGSGCIR